MTPHADVFDPFGDYPEVRPVPVGQAIAEFRELWGPTLRARQRQLHAEIVAGTSTPQTRLEQQREWAGMVKRTELQLFRSLMVE